MLVKLRQLECVRGFIYFMYSLLEMFGKRQGSSSVAVEECGLGK